MKRLFSIIMLFTFVLGNLGLSLGMHNCGGERIDTRFMLGQEHLSCGMEMSESPCQEKRESCQNSFDSSCCENLVYTLNIQVEAKNQKAAFDQGNSIAEFDKIPSIARIQNPPNKISKTWSNFRNSPPWVCVDRVILYESYLI